MGGLQPQPSRATCRGSRMPNRRAPRRLHPALAISVALGLHAAMLFGVRFEAVRGTMPREDEAAIEFSMLTEEAAAGTAQQLPPSEPAESPQAAPHSAARRAASVAALSPEPASDTAGAAPNDTGAAPPDGTDGIEGTEGAAPGKHIDL